MSVQLAPSGEETASVPSNPLLVTPYTEGKAFPTDPISHQRGKCRLVQASRKINGPPPVLAGLITGQRSTELENKGLRLFGERPDYKESREKLINIETKQLV